MTYELAKQIKDAGFLFQFVDKGCTTLERLPDHLCNTPTLSHLIEACGDRFYSLVYAMENDWRCFSEREGDYVDTADGSTPEEEAVAKLWLALHNSR
jgi:hypothetical protein